MTELGPARKATAERLAAELRKVAEIATPDHAAKYESFAKRAETGEFSDYGDAYACPITQLYCELTAAGFTKFARRVANGEFDATKEEADEWARRWRMSGRRREPRSEVECAALLWWKMHRPCKWTEAEHRKNPTINTLSPIEAALAETVAEMLKD